MEVNIHSRQERKNQVRQQILEELQRIQREFSSNLGDDAIAVLALAPYIPSELAQCLPVRGDPLKTLAAAVEAGMVQTGPGPQPWALPIFWMERPAGDSALNDLRSRRPREYAELLMRSLSTSGASMLSEGGQSLESEPTLWRWSKLASAAGEPAHFNAVLTENAGEALRQSRTARVLWSPEARAWIEAAERIGALLQGGFLAAVSAARRGLELFHRRAHDGARLRTYFKREELDQTFRDLLADEEKWALHLVGSGGSGKTMLLRHISVDMAKPEGIAVSRVDFDYLNPQYPERDPLLLLKALAEDFRLDDSGDSVRAFGNFDRACSVVYSRLDRAARSGDNQQAQLADRDVQLAVGQFAEALANLSGRSQPVLILDTCEELAKVQPGGEVPRNVRHTLELLEAVYNAYNEYRYKAAQNGGRGLRVVFSGRRSLPKMDHLRVYRVGGFSERNATEFLEGYRSPDGRPVSRALIPGILRLTRTDDGYGPYDLDTYAGWAAVDDRLTEAKLESAGPMLYIRERIVDRLKPLVRRLLPALATLGRFDTEVVEKLIGHTADPAADLTEVLSQEWVRPDTAGAANTWLLDDLFRQRVLTFYETSDQGDRSALQEARSTLAAILPPLTRTRAFQDLTPQLFAVSLDVLSDTPVKAAEWWEEMEARIAADAEWTWASELMRFLEPEPDAPGAMTAALFATKAAVMLHIGQDPSHAWQVVAKRANEHPKREGAVRLEWRAACALGNPTGGPSAFTPQDAASLLAWAERKVERGDGPLIIDKLLARLVDVIEIKAFAWSLRARATVDREQASEYFQRALALDLDGASEHRQTWLDWIRPANLMYRILLEQLLHTGRPPDDFPFDSPLDSIDADRLVAAWLRSDERTVAFAANPRRAEFGLLYRSSLALAAERPVCVAHQTCPPFFVVFLEAAGLSGEPLPGGFPVDTGFPPDVRLALDTAILKIQVRMRLMSEGVRIPGSAPGNAPLAVIARALSVAGTTVPRELQSQDPLEAAELEFLRGSTQTASAAYHAAELRRDALGCFEARMLVALDCARKGDSEAARREALSARPHYEMLSAPPWSAIEEAARTGSVTSLLDGMGPKPAEWRPWVVRLLACLSAPPSEELKRWVLANDRERTADGATRLAAELDFLAGTSESMRGVFAPLLSKLKDILSFFVGFSVIAGILKLLYAGYGWLLSSAGLTLPTGWQVGSFVVALFAVGSLFAMAPKAFALLLELYSRALHLEVQASPSWPPTELRSRIQFFGLFKSDWQVTRLQPFTERYRAMAIDSGKPSPVKTMLAVFFRWFPRVFLRGEITVDDRSAATPWEAILSPERWLLLRRVTRERRVAAMPEWHAPVDVMTWGGKAIYSRRRDWAAQFRATFAASPEGFSEQNLKAGVLRILASPVDSTSGLVLQIATTGSEPYDVRGAHLLARYPSLRLCIVQCPTAEIGTRLSSDRRNAAMLKQIGAEIFSSGVPAVLVIPVLPERASDMLIDSIYSILALRPSNAVPQLEAALAAFRRQPLDRISTIAEDAEEILQDVCLYASEAVSFKVLP